MVEYLGLADYLLIAEAVLDVPAEVLALSTSLHLADSALNAPAASFAGTELYTPFAQKAAVLCARLCNNHPLLDGNKRVAYESLREFVARNGYGWSDPPGDDPDGDETVKVMWAARGRSALRGRVGHLDRGAIDIEGTMSAAQVWAEAARDDPRIYVACPLTCLDAKSQRQIKSDVLAVKRAIESVTIGDRVEAERWLAVVYAPIDHMAPWKRDGFSPDEVYSRNLAEVHAADALIVIAENGGSAGVGQELEWAVRLGLPILYLTADQAISRQILGAPGFIQAQAYGNDAQTLESHVKNFLRQWKPLILDGPRRRQSRALRYLAIGERLRAAWEGCSNRTLVAAQVRVDVRYLELSLSHPSLLSVMPIETLVSLAHELDVDLANQAPRPVMCLPVPFLRALLAAAEADGWSDGDVERLIFHGRAVIERGEALDLATLAAWRDLYDRL